MSLLLLFAGARTAAKRSGAFYPSQEDLREGYRRRLEREQEERDRELELQRLVEKAWRQAHGLPEPIAPETFEPLPEYEPEWFLDSGFVPDPVVRLPDPALLEALGQQAALPHLSEDEMLRAEVAEEWQQLEAFMQAAEAEAEMLPDDDPAIAEAEMQADFLEVDDIEAVLKSGDRDSRKLAIFMDL